ncbi:acyl-CoA dehydrogenase family protein [Halotia wernerae UHCC 0503]|nr:acyl-CoA dehydrogenase family protein [Halotia wernerae UHCC 0503]
MHFLEQERLTLAQFLPTLDAQLERISLLKMESQGNPAIPLFRELGGPGLIIPSYCNGLGATLLQTVRIQRAIASRSPSLAVATTMHHCTVTGLLESITDSSVVDLLKQITQKNLYLSSGFAEGRTGVSFLSSNINVKRTSDGLVLNGSKKPCSLAKSMDFLTASVLIPSATGKAQEYALVIIPSGTPGLECRPFWNTWVLGGAESDELVLCDVIVPEELIFNLGEVDALGNLLTKGLLGFQLLISASYLGIVSALVERTLLKEKGSPTERMLLVSEVEGAMAALESAAYSVMQGDISDGTFTRILFTRYAVQHTIERVTMGAAELLGGMAFISSNEVAYLLAAARALAFHPPSQSSIAPALDKYLTGKPLVLP